MKKIYGILFLAISVYTSVSSVIFSEPKLPAQESLKHALNLQHQTSPFIHLRIPDESPYLRQIDFSMASENLVRINGYFFNLIGVGFFSQFIDLRIALIDSEDAGKEFESNPENTGMSTHHQGTILILSLPPVPVEMSTPQCSISLRLVSEEYAEKTLSGYKTDPGQPPRI